MNLKLHLIAALLVLFGGIGSLIFHQGAMTPLVVPVIDTLVPPDSGIDLKKSIPFKSKSSDIDLDAPFEERYYFLDFHKASKKHIPYLVAYFLWISGMMLWLIQFGFKSRARFNKVVFLVGSFLCLYGIKHLYQGAAGGIMTFDTMAISGGDPTILSLSIGDCTTAIMVGWVILIVAAPCLFAAPLLPSSRMLTVTEATRKSKVFASIGLGFCLLGYIGIIWNQISYHSMGRLTSKNDPADFAGTISHFLMSHAIIVLASFFLVVFFVISFLVRRKLLGENTES